MAKLNALIIDATEGIIRPAVIDGLKDMQKAVGGLIEPVWYVPRLKGNCLYVDEEGLFKGYQHGFKVNGVGPFHGNGLILGPLTEIGNHTDVTISAANLQIQFLTRAGEEHAE